MQQIRYNIRYCENQKYTQEVGLSSVRYSKFLKAIKTFYDSSSSFDATYNKGDAKYSNVQRFI